MEPLTFRPVRSGINARCYSTWHQKKPSSPHTQQIAMGSDLHRVLCMHMRVVETSLAPRGIFRFLHSHYGGEQQQYQHNNAHAQRQRNFCVSPLFERRGRPVKILIPRSPRRRPSTQFFRTLRPQQGLLNRRKFRVGNHRWNHMPPPLLCGFCSVVGKLRSSH